MSTNTGGLLIKKRVIQFLEQNPEKVFSTKEIATWFFLNYEEASRAIKKNATKKAVIQEVMARISGDRISIEKSPKVIIQKIDGNLNFSYNDSNDTEIKQVNLLSAKNKTGDSDASLTDEAKPAPTGNKKLEEDLYPILREYLESGYPTVYAKHINDHESKKNEGKNGHRWRHPDLVGVERSGEDWGDDIRKCVAAYSGEKPKLKLWSFEVKHEIRKPESREYFFQAVSNSSWANYGYLVAKTIHESAMNDLFILSKLHGIGLIRLNVETPANSQIVIQAKERKEIDWNTADTLVKINPNFKKYIENIRLYYGSDNYWNSDYWEEQIILKKPKR